MAAPIAAAMIIEMITAGARGMPAEWMSVKETKPPSITNSPWAKLMMPVAL
jgi:hypothetical protein